MITQFYNHPSIVGWIRFNEDWGRHDTEEIAAQTKKTRSGTIDQCPKPIVCKRFPDVLALGKLLFCEISIKTGLSFIFTTGSVRLGITDRPGRCTSRRGHFMAEQLRHISALLKPGRVWRNS